MMRILHSLCFGGALIFAGFAVAFADSIPKAMSSYDFVIGNWRCVGLTATQTPQTPGGKVYYRFTQSVSKVLGGRWFRFQPIDRPGFTFMTYQAKPHSWVYIDIDESSYSIGSAPDWVGNKQVWTGNIYSNGARRSWGRIIFTKISDRKKREDFYKPDRTGKFLFKGSEVCEKQ